MSCNVVQNLHKLCQLDVATDLSVELTLFPSVSMLSTASCERTNLNDVLCVLMGFAVTDDVDAHTHRAQVKRKTGRSVRLATREQAFSQVRPPAGTSHAPRGKDNTKRSAGDRLRILPISTCDTHTPRRALGIHRPHLDLSRPCIHHVNAHSTALDAA